MGLFVTTLNLMGDKTHDLAMIDDGIEMYYHRVIHPDEKRDPEKELVKFIKVVIQKYGLKSFELSENYLDHIKFKMLLLDSFDLSSNEWDEIIRIATKMNLHVFDEDKRVIYYKES